MPYGVDDQVSLQKLLSTPGPLHIIDNATKRLIDHLPYLGQAIPRLAAVCRFISSRAYKQRLLATCFAGPVSQSFKNDIQNFHVKVNEGRWGSVAFALPELLKLRHILRRFWDLRAFNHGHEAGQAHDRQDDAGVRIDLVDESIQLPDFWAQFLEAALGKLPHERPPFARNFVRRDVRRGQSVVPCQCGATVLAAAARHFRRLPGILLA